MKDISIVKNNIRKMVDQNASEQDIDDYISSEGYNLDQIKNYRSNQNSSGTVQKEPSFIEKAGRLALEIPTGLGNKFIGAVQSGTDFIAPESQFAGKLNQGIRDLKQKQSQLSDEQRAGIATGETIGDVLFSPFKGVLGAAASGAISGLTTPLEESGAKERLMEVGKDAALGAAFGKGLDLVGKGFGGAKEGTNNIIKGVKARLPEELQAVGEAIKQKSSQLYKAAEDYGVKLKPKATKVILKGIDNVINESGPLFKANHGGTISILSDINEDVANKGYKIGLADLDQYNQALKDVVRNNTDIAGKINSDGYKALQAVNKIDEIVQKLPARYLTKPSDVKAIELLNKGKEEYHRYRKFERISNIVEKADGDPNRIKALVKNFVANKKNLQGFNIDERKALKRASELTTGEGIAKMLGKFGLDLGTSLTAGNTALPVFGALAGSATGGISSGGSIVAIGTMARQAQKYLARGKLDDALKLIQSGGNPSQIISKIPNRKMQEKLLKTILLKTGASAISESNNQ